MSLDFHLSHWPPFVGQDLSCGRFLIGLPAIDTIVATGRLKIGRRMKSCPTNHKSEVTRQKSQTRSQKSSFAPIAPHDEVRLVRQIRTETGIDRAAGAFVHLEIIEERIRRLRVICRDSAAVL